MALTSASSYADAVAQYMDNLSWDGDVTKARAALEAIRYLQLTRATRNTAADGRSLDYEGLAETRRQIEEFLAIYDTTNRPRCSFTRGKAIL
ncbi:MAG: hypothetical protein WC372_08240 [Candidatus Neomarinimicrobiota bacterium]|jgi:hypothetical protein|nr:hypothetical protein [Methanocellales archaeon]